MNFRLINRDEIEKLRKIDRSEIITHIYHYVNGKLLLREEYYNLLGWDQTELNNLLKRLYIIFDRGGTFYGAFNNSSMIGLVSLNNQFIGKNKDQLQIVSLHVSKNFRKKGIGKALFDIAKEKAKKLGAKKLYISATPSKNTVEFYMQLGCKLAKEINKELFELEPEDIHLEFKF